MKKSIVFFGADADQWETDGMSIQDEDALILAIWRWYRGREDTSQMGVVAKVLYSMIIKRLEATEEKSETLSSYGKKGAENRWKKAKKNGVANGVANGQAIEKVMANAEWPTTTSTSTTTSISTPTPINKESMGGTPMPPALAENKKSTRFIKPTEDEVREYCREKGYTKVNAANFIDYYESNGWIVGKTPMKNWRSAVSRWERNERNYERSAAPNKDVGVVLETPENVKEEDYVIG